MGTPTLPFGNTYILLKKLIILLKRQFFPLKRLFILLKRLFIPLKRLFIPLKSLLMKFWSFATKTKTKTKKPPLIGKALSCLAGVFRFGFRFRSLPPLPSRTGGAGGGSYGFTTGSSPQPLLLPLLPLPPTRYTPLVLDSSTSPFLMR